MTTQTADPAQRGGGDQFLPGSPDGHQVNDLYHMVLGEVEPVLLNVVMQHVDGNQSQAADMLGISRETLRKKLKQYGLDQ